MDRRERTKKKNPHETANPISRLFFWYATSRVLYNFLLILAFYLGLLTSFEFLSTRLHMLWLILVHQVFAIFCEFIANTWWILFSWIFFFFEIFVPNTRNDMKRPEKRVRKKSPDGCVCVCYDLGQSESVS